MALKGIYLSKIVISWNITHCIDCMLHGYLLYLIYYATWSRSAVETSSGHTDPNTLPIHLPSRRDENNNVHSAYHQSHVRTNWASAEHNKAWIEHHPGSQYRFMSPTTLSFVSFVINWIRERLGNPWRLPASTVYILYNVWCLLSTDNHPSLYPVSSKINKFRHSIFLTKVNRSFSTSIFSRTGLILPNYNILTGLKKCDAT